MDIKEAKNKTTDTIVRHPWELARMDIIIKMIKEITAKIKNAPVSLIDIGCGDLFVLETLGKTFGFDEYFGIDIAFSRDFINSYESHNKQIKLYDNLSRVTVKKNNISIVLLLDVIEHIEDDAGFLENLREYDFVNENSYFLITVPSFQSLFCSHDTFLEHYRRYSNHQLVELLKKKDFNVISGGYFFTSLLLPRLLETAKERLFMKNGSKHKDGTDLTTWNGGRLVTSFIKSILLADYGFSMLLLKLGIRIPGLSNYSLARPKQRMKN